MTDKDFIERAWKTWQITSNRHRPAYGPIVDRLFDIRRYNGKSSPDDPIETVRFTFEECRWYDDEADKVYAWWNVIANGIIIDMVWDDRDDSCVARMRT